jgi:hypothetical protein
MVDRALQVARSMNVLHTGRSVLEGTHSHLPLTLREIKTPSRRSGISPKDRDSAGERHSQVDDASKSWPDIWAKEAESAASPDHFNGQEASIEGNVGGDRE